MEVKRGATRLVVLAGNYAVKIPNPATWRSFLSGLLSNMEERGMGRLRHPLLCPVLWGIRGGWLVVMPAASPLCEYEFRNYVDVSQFQCVTEAIEGKPDSFGWLAGRIVAVDYG